MVEVCDEESEMRLGKIQGDIIGGGIRKRMGRGMSGCVGGNKGGGGGKEEVERKKKGVR